MTSSIGTAARPPWHFWLVALIAVVWNGFGAYDFVMSLTRGEAYYRAMGATDAMIAAHNAMPGWMFVVWIVGVWGSVVGTLLMIARSRFALHAFVASLAAVVLMLAYNYLLSNAGAAGGRQGMVMGGMILAAAVVFAAYAWAMAKRGVLR